MPGSNCGGSATSNTTKYPSRGRNSNSSPMPHQMEYELSKDGELVPVPSGSNVLYERDEQKDNEGAPVHNPNCDAKMSPEISVTASRSKRKQTFERKNIKRVREENSLSEEAQSAQKAEMERRLRLQMEYQAQLPKSNNSDLWSPMSNISTDQPTPSLPCPEAIQMKPKLGKDMKLYDKPVFDKLIPKTSASQTASTASEKLFKQKQLQALQTGDTEETAIVLLGDSDDEIELPINDAEIKITNNQVIELSDDDDLDVVGDYGNDGDNREEDEVQAEFCELRDAENLPDTEGRICIRRGSTTAESFYLAPHIARVIKPHQVSGVRFLFDNLVEDQTQFERNSGFGCILAHSMGLGKSIQVIAFLDLIFRYCRPPPRTVLLIVPINTLQNWQTEFQTWLPSVLYPTDEEKPKINGHQSISATDFNVPTTVTAVTSHQLPPVVHSEPSLLSLINDSPPPPPSNLSGVEQSEMRVATGEPQFPPPPPSTSPLVEQSKAEEAVPEAPSFRLHVIKDTTKSLDARYQVVSEWAQVGGVLLMGYEMFRLLTNPRKQNRVNSVSSGSPFVYSGGIPINGSTSALFSPSSLLPDYEKPSSRKRKRPITIDVEKEEKEEHMLSDMRIALTDPGPQIVICDEGHRIKNSEASISRALKALRTQRRVVLTGYPLQNNLMEYWCMVDFVRPNYLGTKAEFTNMFQRPIENGQCVDSTEADRKLMQGRAHVLHELLSGFVQRRSHAVLKASLPPKQEIVLMVRMSPLQRRLYTALMNHISNSSNMYGTVLPPANTLQTYALCCKIWNHPDVLWRVVKENVDEMMDFELDDASNTANGGTNQRTKRKVNGSNPVVSGGSSTIDDKYAWVTNDLWGVDFRAGDVRNSGKLILFLSLLWESVRMGDKMLLFSQSLLTLDLIERLLGRLPLDSERPPSPSQSQTSQEQLHQQQLEEEEETEKTVHYRFNRRMGNDPSKQPQVWIRNVHYFRLDGSTSATDRDRLIRRFNDPTNSVRLFLVSTRAGSLGVNLVGANRVVVFDASWNPCHDCQAVCRVYRYGQEKPCYIYRLVSDNTMERKIYDRQVNKQGVSDRVVDEMNPGQQFTRAQVGILTAYEDKEMPSLSDEDLQSISELTSGDFVLKATLERNREWITTKPFTHESLLIDRKDYRLTRIEKRIARQRYEEERRVSSSSSMYRSSAAATVLQYHQYMMAAAAASNASFNPYGNMPVNFAPPSQRGTPNILSRSTNTIHHQTHPIFPPTPYSFIPPVMDDSAARRYEGIQRNRMLQKDLDEARIRAVSREIGITLPNGPLGNDYKITRVAASTDLIFPQSTHPPAPERSISKGEVVEIIQAGNNGKYLRLPRTGDIYVVKPAAKETSESNDTPQQQQAPQQHGEMQTQIGKITPSASTSLPLPHSSVSPLCSRCRHPTSASCLCSSNLYSFSSVLTPASAPPPPPPSAAIYHPPTYTNQYAPAGSYVPPTTPQSYPNY
ncbi:helicase arip4 [Echinococcus multilocularis]|uniref:Helicase arip4 n=1 Tax=Echinococcus multilocularis TaxID=6211 RepID=A0A068YDD3_ECHMU|nr:helicase arip4 [Echinococcus multilocularis]